MFRGSASRACRGVCRLTAAPKAAVNRGSQCRRLQDGPGRWLPVFPRRGMGFPGPGNFFRMMDEQFRDMQRAVDDFMPRYGFGRPSRDMEVKYSKRDFVVRLDVGDYSPEEVQVKLVDDVVEISGKHSSQADKDSSYSTQFTRQFKLPDDVDPETLECTWTDCGALMVRGHIKGSENLKERVINITREKSTDKKDKE